MSRARRARKPALGRLLSTAKVRYFRTGPRKVRAVVDLIRGLTVLEAEQQLMHIHRPSSVTMLRRLLKSAVSNANREEKTYKPEELIVGDIQVDSGPTTTRFQPRAMGRAAVIRKRTSHITVKLFGDPRMQEAE